MQQPKLLIVDLDNTLCDTYRSLSIAQWTLVANAFESKGKLEYARGLRKEFGKQGFAKTLQMLGMSAAEKHFAIKMYDTIDVKRVKLYPDAEALLRVPIPKVLTSRGEQKLQDKKIRHLNIQSRFDSVVIVGTFETKEYAFRKLLRGYHLKPAQALVIGDRTSDEIAAAKKIGIPTCLIRRPDWPWQKGRGSFTVTSLRTLAKRLDASRP